jgi:hypothetical protein
MLLKCGIAFRRNSQEHKFLPAQFTRGSLVVKTLSYKPEGRGFESDGLKFT